MQLPEHTKIAPLLAFNVGVELGQLAVVLAVVPALAALRREEITRRAQVAIAIGGALGGAVIWPFEIICALGIWVLTAAALVATPRLGYARTVVRGGSLLAIGLGGLWFLLRLGGGLLAL